MFKIAKAEFFKILHMPLFYIILIIVMSSSFIVSMFIDKTPETINNQQSFTYNNFITQDKTTFDKNLLEVETVINLFNTANNQVEDLYLSLNYVYEAFNALEQATTDNGIREAINNITNKLNEFKTNLEDKKQYYEDENSISYKLLSSELYTSNIAKDIILLLNNIDTVKNQNQTDLPTQKFNILSAYENANYDQKLLSAYDNALNYGNYILNLLTSQVINNLNTYYSFYNQSSPLIFENNIDKAYSLYNEFILSTENYLNILSEMVLEGNLALINSETYINITKTLNSFITESKAIIPPSQIPETIVEKNTRSSHNNIIKLIKNLNLKNVIQRSTNSLIFVDFNPELINEFINIKNKTALNQDVLLNKININKDSNNVSDLILSYKLLCENSKNLVKNLVLKNAINDLPQDISSSFYGSEFKNYSKYKLNENIEKQYYYLNTNSYDNSYTPEPMISFNSNDNLNFIYTSIKISAILLILVSIIFASILITKEQKSGSMKFLISKPFSRLQIVSGKHLTLFILIAFYLFISLISTLISSNLLFGSLDLNKHILLIFNASNAFKINVILYFALFTLMQVFEVFFYTLVACMFAFMFWSVFGTILTSITSIATIFSINFLFKSELWSSFLPFYNANLFKYFGSGLRLDANNLFQEILLSNINSNSNFFLSLGVIALYSLIIYIVTYIIAQKRSY